MKWGWNEDGSFTAPPESVASRAPSRLVVTHPKANPCVEAFGAGPEGKRCKTCKHLYRKWYDKAYIKCDLRPDTNGPGTDHRVNWPACRRYEEEDNNNSTN